MEILHYKNKAKREELVFKDEGETVLVWCKERSNFAGLVLERRIVEEALRRWLA